MPDEQTPKADEQTPKADEQTPKADEQTPKADEQTPKVDEQTPKADEQKKPVADEQGENSKPNIQFSVGFELVKNEYIGIYEKGTETKTVDGADKKINRNELLVSIQDPKNKPVSCTFDQMLTEVCEKFPIEQRDLKRKVQDFVGAEKLEKATVKLTTLFLHTVSLDDKRTTTYAFVVEMNLNGLLDLGFINIKTLKFAIWNTNSQKVIDAMELTTIADQLKEKV